MQQAAYQWRTRIRDEQNASALSVLIAAGAALLKGRRRSALVPSCTAFLVVARSHAPPADLAPDPVLVGQIRDILIIPGDGGACPGAKIGTNYVAVLSDGSRMPFARSYGSKHPQPLYVAFLDRTSPDAVPRADGDWMAARDPLATVSTGFRLTASLRAKPSITSAIGVPPSYGCLPHSLSYQGTPGGIAGMSGGDGVDVTVRLAMVRSPLHDTLYVAGIQVGSAAPFYTLRDGSRLTSTWLFVESQGGTGGDGLAGASGVDGASGAPGCPAQPGWSGSSGLQGGAGGGGGRGGNLRIMVFEEQAFLAALVEDSSPGGSGGAGGPGGAGGRGGSGGKGMLDANNQWCSDAADGASGVAGPSGLAGSSGSWGSRSVIVKASAKDVFGPAAPPSLAALLERPERQP